MAPALPELPTSRPLFCPRFPQVPDWSPWGAWRLGKSPDWSSQALTDPVGEFPAPQVQNCSAARSGRVGCLDLRGLGLRGSQAI